MQNRVATALMMAVSATLNHMEVVHGWSENQIGHFFDSVEETAGKLLKGEDVAVGTGQQDTMRLSGSDPFALNWNDGIAQFLDNADPTPKHSNEGYCE